METILVCASLGAMVFCGCGRPTAENAGKTGGTRQEVQSNRAMLDIAPLLLKMAYDNECKRIDIAFAKEATHYGDIARGNAIAALRKEYGRIVNSWLKETSSCEEWRLVGEYAPTLEEALVSRTRLLEKIGIWNRIGNAKGVFAGQEVCFANGAARYMDRSCDWAKSLRSTEYKDGFPMKVRIDRNFAWTAHGNDYALAHSDAESNINDEIEERHT